jgi:chorismate synthase
MSNTLGNLFRITSFGESHGPSVGIVIDGLPSNFEIDLTHIQNELNRRKPGQSSISTTRQEDDNFEIISGVFENKSTGSPITIIIPNKDSKSADYTALKEIYRPGHADKVYQYKYGHRDYRGGGRSSARITAAWVAAGAIAKQYLEKKFAIKTEAIVSSIKDIHLASPFEDLNWELAETNIVRCPNESIASKMIQLIRDTKEKGDSLGGIISARISNVPIGIGEPVFGKLNAQLAHALFSINAVKGVEFGSGFKSTLLYGSENNDQPNSTKNNDGGITGGISNGKAVEISIAFKPTSSISKEQNVENISNEIVPFSITGRHDPCVLPRSVPIVEAVIATVVLDSILINLKNLQLK